MDNLDWLTFIRQSSKPAPSPTDPPIAHALRTASRPAPPCYFGAFHDKRVGIGPRTCNQPSRHHRGSRTDLAKPRSQRLHRHLPTKELAPDQTVTVGPTQIDRIMRRLEFQPPELRTSGRFHYPRGPGAPKVKVATVVGCATSRWRGC